MNELHEPEPTTVGDKARFTLRHLRAEDYTDVAALMNQVYANQGGAWTKQHFTAQLKRFPEGQICIDDQGCVVAVALSLIVDYAKFGDEHTYATITGNGFITTHDPKGDVLYGMDVFVHPDYRGQRLGRRLYDARKELCENLNLKAIVAGGRIPGYASRSGEMSPQKYIELCQRREIFDPILSFQLANDFHVLRVLKGYWPEDRESRSYATLLRWNNIYYEPAEAPLIGQKEPVVRLGTVQWQMRPLESVDAFLNQVEFFVDSVAGHNADFVLFPEFFSTPLLAQFNELDPAQAMRALASHTEEIRNRISHLAVSYNINIIAGTMPVHRDAKLYNVSYFLRRDGSWDAQYKLHITPDERSTWGVVGGTRLRVFDSDMGKVGILICYDVEFPELGRMLLQDGMKLLFVPFWTDTQNSYLRVRLCAQARAIENECYVAITGNVGSLPEVENIDIQYSQTAIFSPSDFAFPQSAIMAEAAPNTETTLVVDVDLDLLKDLRNEGSVRNFHDRRHDLYEIVWKGQS